MYPSRVYLVHLDGEIGANGYDHVSISYGNILYSKQKPSFALRASTTSMRVMWIRMVLSASTVGISRIPTGGIVFHCSPDFVNGVGFTAYFMCSDGNVSDGYHRDYIQNPLREILLEEYFLFWQELIH